MRLFSEKQAASVLKAAKNYLKGEIMEEMRELLIRLAEENPPMRRLGDGGYICTAIFCIAYGITNGDRSLFDSAEKLKAEKQNQSALLIDILADYL